MKLQLMRRDTDILKYQASKEYEFLIIACIVRDHLAILATPAASKCVFSVSSDIITKIGNRLGASNTKRLLCLRDQGILEEGEDEEDSNVDIDLDMLDCQEQLYFTIILV